MALNFGKLNFSTSFNPTSAFPIDARQYFESYSSAAAAAATAVEVGSADSTYYIGMPLVVVENSVATLYTINGDKTLKEAGGSIQVDDKTIVVGEDGKLTLDGFVDATTGQQPRIASDGTLEWYTPDTSTVSGLQEAVGALQSDVAGIETDLAENYYDKTEVDAKITSVYKPGGSYAFGSLPEPSASNVGYVYDVTDGFTTDERFAEGAGKTYPAGTNVVVIASGSDPVTYKYDVMSGMVDLSGYATTEALNNGLAAKVDETTYDTLPETILVQIMQVARTANTNTVEVQVSTKQDDGTYSTAEQHGVLTLIGAGMGPDSVDGAGLMVASDKTKLDSIESGAEANVITAIQANGTNLPISEKTVNIPGATASALGLVRSSTDENKISVDSNGIMEVNSLNVMKLTQTAGDTLVINGGSSVVE